MMRKTGGFVTESAHHQVPQTSKHFVFHFLVYNFLPILSLFMSLCPSCLHFLTNLQSAGLESKAQMLEGLLRIALC